VTPSAGRKATRALLRFLSESLCAEFDFDADGGLFWEVPLSQQGCSIRPETDLWKGCDLASKLFSCRARRAFWDEAIRKTYFVRLARKNGPACQKHV
jgi:hypothetical protein